MTNKKARLETLKKSLDLTIKNKQALISLLASNNIFYEYLFEEYWKLMKDIRQECNAQEVKDLDDMCNPVIQDYVTHSTNSTDHLDSLKDELIEATNEHLAVVIDPNNKTEGFILF